MSYNDVFFSSIASHLNLSLFLVHSFCFQVYYLYLSAPFWRGGGGAGVGCSVQLFGMFSIAWRRLRKMIAIPHQILLIPLNWFPYSKSQWGAHIINNVSRSMWVWHRWCCRSDFFSAPLCRVILLHRGRGENHIFVRGSRVLCYIVQGRGLKGLSWSPPPIAFSK